MNTFIETILRARASSKLNKEIEKTKDLHEQTEEQVNANLKFLDEIFSVKPSGNV